MRTIEVKLYKYDELSDEAKQKAIEKLWCINTEHDWWDFIYEDATIIGLDIDSFDLDRNRHAQGSFIKSAINCAQLIRLHHGDKTETYATASDYIKRRELLFAQEPDATEHEMSFHLEQMLEELDAEFLKSILEDYAMILQKESEYLSSREAVEETIRANDYEFTEDGKLH